MPDWTRSMQQTFEFCYVDPISWTDKGTLDSVKSGSAIYDLGADTLGSASFSITEEIEECYIRPYLVTNQDGLSERFPFGTYLCTTPGKTFDGRVDDISVDAYTPLIELSENPPPLGYAVLKNRNIIDIAGQLAHENMRAPVIPGKATDVTAYDFVANVNDTWLTFLKDLIATANYEFSLDELGRLLFSPKVSLNAMRPVWTFDDSNSSILYPSIEFKRDLYGIPNVVEIAYSKDDIYLFARAENDDPKSPVSTISRGRTITKRITDPEVSGTPNQEFLNQYAKTALRELSSLEYTLTYTHGYCPVRVGDCVRLNYERAGLTNIKAKVIRQSVRFEPGTPVEETAVFSSNLWG